MSSLIAWVKGALDVWSFFAVFGVVPTVGTVIAATRSALSPIEIALCVLGVVAYWIVLVVEARPYVDAIGKRDRPRLEFARVADGTVAGSWSESVRVVQLWFRNRPRVSSAASVAKHVTVTVRIEMTGRTPLEVVGAWALTKAPNNVGFPDGLASELDVPPNDIPAKPGVIARYSQDDDAYCLIAETLHRGFRHPDYAIPPGEHRVIVRLPASASALKSSRFRC